MGGLHCDVGIQSWTRREKYVSQWDFDSVRSVTSRMMESTGVTRAPNASMVLVERQEGGANDSTRGCVCPALPCAVRVKRGEGGFLSSRVCKLASCASLSSASFHKRRGGCDPLPPSPHCRLDLRLWLADGAMRCCPPRARLAHL